MAVTLRTVDRRVRHVFWLAGKTLRLFASLVEEVGAPEVAQCLDWLVGRAVDAKSSGRFELSEDLADVRRTVDLAGVRNGGSYDLMPEQVAPGQRGLGSSDPEPTGPQVRRSSPG